MDDEGGYETYTSTRYALLRPGSRPFPYAPGAADRYIGDMQHMIETLADAWESQFMKSGRASPALR